MYRPTHTGAELLALPILTERQAATLGLLAAAGITYCGRDGARALASGPGLDGAPLAFVVSPEGVANRLPRLARQQPEVATA